MKKASRGVLSLLLCAVLFVCCCTGASAGDNSFSPEQWASYWETYTKDGSAVCLQPGGSDDQMNFSWLSAPDDEKPFVLLSTSSTMTPAYKLEGVSAGIDSSVVSNRVSVKNLTAGTRYYYQCCSGESKTALSSFVTASGKDFTVLAVSDLHINGDTVQNTEMIEKTNRLHNLFSEAEERAGELSMVLSAGDQADGTKLAEYIGAFSSPYLKNIPLATSIGNHDTDGFLYQKLTCRPNVDEGRLAKSLYGGDYWFVKGDALFLMLDSNSVSAADHYSFVENAVAKNPGVKWRIAVWHHDLTGGHNPNRENEARFMRKLFMPIADKFEFDLVINGHSHFFSRSNVIKNQKTVLDTSALGEVKNPDGTVYLVCGSTGRPRLPEGTASSFVAADRLSDTDVIYSTLSFAGDKLAVNSYAVGEEEAFDSFTIEKTGTKGGHTAVNVPIWYGFMKYLGTACQWFENIGIKLGID